MKTCLKGFTSLVFILLSTNALADYVLDEKFDAAYAGELVLDTDLGSVDIHTHDRQQIAVHVSVTGADADDFSVEFIERSNGLDISGEHKFRDDYSRSRSIDLRVRYELLLPHRYDVNVHTAGGSIRVAELEGRTRVHTSGGSLELADIKGVVEGKTSGGSIEIRNLQGPVNIETSGGSISMQNIDGPIRAHTAGGSIHIDAASGAHPIKAGTSGGSISARIIDGVRHDVHLSTAGGNVDAYFPQGSAINIDARGSAIHNGLGEFQGNQSQWKLEGKINGGGPPVSLRTSGGSVSINPL